MKIYIPSSMFKRALKELKAYNNVMSGKWFTNAYFQLHPVEIVEIKPLLTESENGRSDTSLKRNARKDRARELTRMKMNAEGGAE